MHFGSEAPHRALFDRGLLPMYVSTKAGLFVEVNQAFAHLLGYEREELVGTEVEKTLALPLERRRFKFEMDTHGRVSQFQLKLLSRSLEVISATVEAVAVDGLPGGLAGYLGVVNPAKASVPTLTGLDREMKRLSLAVQGANDGLWDWDLVRGNAYFNPRWKAIVGHDEPEIGSRIHEWFDRIHVQDQAPVKQALAGVIRGATGQFSIHFRIKRKDGKYLWALARGLGEYTDTGRCHRLAGSMSDVTSHIKLVEKERQQSQRLEDLNASLNQDRSLLSQYFSGDMLSAIFQEGTGRIRENVGPAAVLQVHFNALEGLWAEIGTETYASLMNDLITDVMDLIYGCQGSVNKILGDSLLATFGCPLPEGDDLARAHRAAGEIRRYLKTFNDVRPDFLKKPLSVSMGLTYGEVFSGTMGSVHRLEYAAIGTPVERAATLQRLAASRGMATLVDHEGLLADYTGYLPLEGEPGIWSVGA